MLYYFTGSYPQKQDRLYGTNLKCIQLLSTEAAPGGALFHKIKMFIMDIGPGSNFYLCYEFTNVHELFYEVRTLFIIIKNRSGNSL